MRSVIDVLDLTVEELEELVKVADDIIENPQKYSEKCKGKKLATLFYEPSTRTQMSFQTAMLRLGGSIIGFDNPSTSSVAKGENLKDTTTIIIAQRVTSVQDADRIIVMDEGTINAIGTHEDLLANNAIYQEVYSSQQKGAE